MQMIFKAITLGAITKGVSVDSEKYRQEREENQGQYWGTLTSRSQGEEENSAKILKGETIEGGEKPREGSILGAM